MTNKVPKAGHLIPAVLLLVSMVYSSGYLLLGEKWGLRSTPDEYCRIFPNNHVTQIYAPMLYTEGIILTGRPIEGYEKDALEVRRYPSDIIGTEIQWIPLHWERR